MNVVCLNIRLHVIGWTDKPAYWVYLGSFTMLAEYTSLITIALYAKLCQVAVKPKEGKFTREVILQRPLLRGGADSAPGPGGEEPQCIIKPAGPGP